MGWITRLYRPDSIFLVQKKDTLRSSRQLFIEHMAYRVRVYRLFLETFRPRQRIGTQISQMVTDSEGREYLSPVCHLRPRWRRICDNLWNLCTTNGLWHRDGIAVCKGSGGEHSGDSVGFSDKYQ